ncbi:hypothetical protein D3C81_273660 [compost metagenome]
MHPITCLGARSSQRQLHYGTIFRLLGRVNTFGFDDPLNGRRRRSGRQHHVLAGQYATVLARRDVDDPGLDGPTGLMRLHVDKRPLSPRGHRRIVPAGAAIRGYLQDQAIFKPGLQHAGDQTPRTTICRDVVSQCARILAHAGHGHCIRAELRDLFDQMQAGGLALTFAVHCRVLVDVLDAIGQMQFQALVAAESIVAGIVERGALHIDGQDTGAARQRQQPGHCVVGSRNLAAGVHCLQRVQCGDAEYFITHSDLAELRAGIHSDFGIVVQQVAVHPCANGHLVEQYL